MIKNKFKKTIAFLDDHSTAILLVTLSGLVAVVAYDSKNRLVVRENEYYIPDSMLEHMIETGASVVSDVAAGTLRLTFTPAD